MMPAPPPPLLLRDATRLRDALLELQRAVRSRDRERARRYDLSVSQYHALQTLARRGPLTVNDLAAQLHLEKSTASRLAQSLLKETLVRKRAPDSDGRVVILQVTEAGQRLSRRILNDLTTEYMEILEGCATEVRDTLPQGLERLAAAFAAVGSTPGPG